MKSLLIVLALLLVFPAALASPDGDHCKPVNAVWYLTDYLEGAEKCDGFDYCIPGSLTGTPNGELTYFGNGADRGSGKGNAVVFILLDQAGLVCRTIARLSVTS